MKIGFIGLGIMGSRMAKNLIQAGYEVTVYNRTIEKADELVSLGAKKAKTVQEAAKECKIFITMLSTPAAVQESATGEEGFLISLPDNSIWIDCSTVNPEFSREMSRIAEINSIRFIDAPVSGSKVPAETKQLIFLAGGKAEDVKEVEPVLMNMGKAVIHAGESGMGSALKLVINSLIGFSIAGFTEAFSLGRSFGFSKEFLLNTLPGLPVTAPIIEMKKQKLLDGDYSPEFPLQWMHKDIHLAAYEAFLNNQPMPVLNSVKELFAFAKDRGLGQEDIIALIKIFNK